MTSPLSPERLLVTLSGDVAAVSKRLDSLEKAKLADKVGELKEQMETITRILVQLTAEAEEEEPEDPPPHIAPDWRTLSADHAAVWWDYLVNWGRKVLYPTYAQPVWRPCWFKHPLVVEELTWLCADWHYSYKAGSVPPTRAGDWHTRYWPHVSAQLTKRFERCIVPARSYEDLDRLQKSVEGMSLTPEQQASLDAWNAEQEATRPAREAEKARRAAALRRSSNPEVQVAAEELVVIKPLHPMRADRERDFADDEELSQWIADDLAERREREKAAAEAAALTEAD